MGHVGFIAYIILNNLTMGRSDGEYTSIDFRAIMRNELQFRTSFKYFVGAYICPIELVSVLALTILVIQLNTDKPLIHVQ